MVLIRKIAALLLVALWLPTAQHCILEAAGLLAEQENHAAHQSCCSSVGGACDSEICNLIESGNYHLTTALVTLPAPVMTECACLLYPRDVQILFEAMAMPEEPCASFERPRDCSPTWQFVQRAAPSPRSPSLTVA